MAQPVEKTYYNFSRGINTEASLIDFPSDFSADEQNYELLQDGSRRRRRGLGEETNEAPLSGLDVDIGDAVVAHKWSTVAGNPERNFIVMQLGSDLHFFDDAETVTGTHYGTVIDLLTYKVTTAFDDEVAGDAVDVAYGRGHAFVTGKFIDPIWLRFNETDDTLTVTRVNIKERDFEGVEDGIDNVTRPVTPTDSHTYNLLNRGWTQANLTAFRAAQPDEPSKAMIMWRGLARQSTGGVAEQDWTKAFSPAKLVAELFQDASAPQGHFIRDPFDTTTIQVPGAGASFAVETWTISGTAPGAQTITLTTDGNHGLSAAQEFHISGQNAQFRWSFLGFDGIASFNFNGFHTVASTPALDQITFTVTLDPFFSFFQSWFNQYQQLGTLTNSTTANPFGYVVPFRPRCCAFFAGRVWFAGTPHEKLSTKIFFSQIIESDGQYGKCYQVADPTDEFISDIVPSDGGTIIIPEATDVIRLIPYGAFLLVFSSTGVWQIGPGADGYFTATAYSIKKITDAGAFGARAIVVADNVPFYWGNHDIYALVQDQNSGYLTARNMTREVFHKAYNSLAFRYKNNAQGVYDDLAYRIIWVHGDNVGDDQALTPYHYNKSIVLDLRLAAFTRNVYAFDSTTHLGGIFTVREVLTSNESRKVKYIEIDDNGDVMRINETNRLDFLDFGLANEQEAFMVTGPETIVAQQFGQEQNDAAFKRYAPYVTVFSKKTETGYTEVAGDFVPLNASSTRMQARWDWADLSVAGKWGQSQEVYRHLRLYQPVDVNDEFEDGVPVIVTRNKVRGRGHSLQLLFRAGDGRDSWLMGWKTNFLVV